MVLTFFPWREPNFAPEDALIWATGLVGLAGAIAPILAASSAAAKRSEAAAAAGAGGFSALAAAGLSQISNEIKPDSIAGFASIATFKDFAADYGEAMRKSLDTWSNTTFTGEKDASNYTIFDYLSGGSLTDATLLPSTSQIESFYKKQLFSAIINAQWRKRKIFTTFHRTNDSLSSSGPNATRYYSQKDGGVYYTYFYHESGILKGYLDAPEGLAQLNESAWGISGGDISKASAASAKVGGFNYTEEMGRGALSEAIASNGSLSPWEDGAGWRGTWTMPVLAVWDVAVLLWGELQGYEGLCGGGEFEGVPDVAVWV
ncbi:hypothetical protein GRF29_28g563392 [Pseudopithomyces chartarum]|uniref:Uncharacterized protein n=1 Tax=Pseudopithomyces chartarum TaxID=1892770 RepID=A0AAN6M2G7_9PLEO|nr:hypothetical protein GRF29_28g563392 [Pseudopithomyces chartarum]